jgi:hydroxypyruvate reductase
MEASSLLRALFAAAVEAVSAERCMPARIVGAKAGGRTVVIAIGKGAAAMAAVAARRIEGPCEGLVVTRYGHAGPPHVLPPSFTLIEAGHPVPDEAGTRAAQLALDLAHGLGEGDHLLMLVSGGGSALLVAPVDGVSLADKQAVTRDLLRSGAAIGEINCVRKHLSKVKGGRLAVAAAPAKVTTLLISDIPGDDPSLVASGPTIADPTTLADARAVLARYGIEPPASVAAALANEANETPGTRAPGLAGAEVAVLATAGDALAAAEELARANGFAVTNLGGELEGEARDLGAEHAVLARRLAGEGGRQVLLSGGETTVTVRARGGRGGRNVEYLLGLALALDGAAGVHAIACDTDGIDGTQDNAGAVAGPDSLARAAMLGLDPRAALNGNDAYSLFAALDDLVVTGPTRTNVNDFRAILIDGGSAHKLAGKGV